MDGFESKLNKILSNPEALEQVASIAKSLSGGGAAPEERSPEPDEAAVPASGGLGSLLGALGGDSLDPRMLSGLIEMFGEYSRDDDRRVLLLDALKPYVRAERGKKMDRAVMIVKLARTMRKGLGLLGGGDDNV